MRIGYTSGDDTPPLMDKVPEPPPSHWGKLTTNRAESPEYLRFFFGTKATNIRKEAENGKPRKPR